MSKEIKQNTPSEILDTFYNFHLKEIVSSWINIALFKSKDPNEQVGFRAGPSIGKNTLPTRIEVKAKDALKKEVNRFENQAMILDAILKKKGELKSIKSPEDIWRK